MFSQELQIFRFAVGSGLFSLLILAIAALNFAYTGVFLAAGLAVIVPVFRIREAERVPLPDFSHGWKLFFGLVLLGFGVFYFINALAPEISPDGSSYHLGLVARYFRQHGLGHITTSIYANLSEGLEMLFLSAFSFGRHSSATLIEFSFFLMIPLTMVAYSQRFGFPKVGVAAALMIFCSPVFAISGSSAYNDAATVFLLFCLFYVLQIWDRTRQPGLLVVAGLLAGFSYGVKYSAFIATPYCIGYVAWKLYRAKKPIVRPLAAVAGCALLLIAPWWIKNLVIVGNPISPFGNRIFANPNVTPHFEHDYLQGQRPTGTLSARILESTIHGGAAGGFLGPLFLLTPLGLLALRYKQGRQIVLAAGLFLLPAFSNAQTRFLMLPAPFLALALALAVWKARGGLLIFALAAPIFALPAVADIYCDPWAWRLHDFPVADAVRAIGETESLNRRGGGRTIDLINANVPAAGKLLAMTAPPWAYVSSEVIVSYESALGENLRDLLMIPIDADFLPSWVQTFRFPPQPLRAVRVVQTASGTDADEWSVAEMRIFGAGRQTKREHAWRFFANANPWDVEYAFDDQPVTRWRSRIAMFRDMRLGVDFGRTEDVDTVEVDCAHDQWGIRLKLEGQDASGQWKLLSGSPAISDRPVAEDLRRPAIEQLKKRGITHILLNQGDFWLADFQNNGSRWGIALVGQAGENWLYEIK